MRASTAPDSFSTDKQKYFVSLDLLRFACAISIIFFHYQGFYTGTSGSSVSFVIEKQPLYEYFSFFYTQTFHAVPMFWILSGIVLSHVYLNNRKEFKWRNFAVNRFSRLYPLHLFALLLVITSQLFSGRNFGEHQIYSCNYGDLLPNLLLLSDGNSCNAPEWSVTVEIFVYFIFVLFLSSVKKFYQLWAFGIFLTALLIYLFTYWLGSHSILTLSDFGLVKWGEIFNCTFYFFVGVFLYLLNKTKSTILLTLSLISSVLLNKFVNMFVNREELLLFSIVLSFLIIDRFDFWKMKKIAKIARTLGNQTYAIYLLHTPVMIAILNVMKWRNIDVPKIVNNNYFFAIYLLMINLLAFVTYKYVENPIQKRIRNKYAGV